MPAVITQAIFFRRRHQTEKATARQDQAGEASTDGGAGT
jgi:hypothetical protein